MSTTARNNAAATRRTPKPDVQAGRHRQRPAPAAGRPATPGKSKAKIVAAGVIGTTALAMPLAAHWGADAMGTTASGATTHLTADQVLRAGGTHFRGYTKVRPAIASTRDGRQKAPQRSQDRQAPGRSGTQAGITLTAKVTQTGTATDGVQGTAEPQGPTTPRLASGPVAQPVVVNPGAPNIPAHHSHSGAHQHAGFRTPRSFPPRNGGQRDGGQRNHGQRDHGQRDHGQRAGMGQGNGHGVVPPPWWVSPPAMHPGTQDPSSGPAGTDATAQTGTTTAGTGAATGTPVATTTTASTGTSAPAQSLPVFDVNGNLVGNAVNDTTTGATVLVDPNGNVLGTVENEGAGGGFVLVGPGGAVEGSFGINSTNNAVTLVTAGSQAGQAAGASTGSTATATTTAVTTGATGASTGTATTTAPAGAAASNDVTVPLDDANGHVIGEVQINLMTGSVTLLGTSASAAPATGTAATSGTATKPATGTTATGTTATTPTKPATGTTTATGTTAKAPAPAQIVTIPAQAQAQNPLTQLLGPALQGLEKLFQQGAGQQGAGQQGAGQQMTSPTDPTSSNQQSQQNQTSPNQPSSAPASQAQPGQTQPGSAPASQAQPGSAPTSPTTQPSSAPTSPTTQPSSAPTSPGPISGGGFSGGGFSGGGFSGGGFSGGGFS